MQQILDLFVECRYFKFQNEIQLSSILTVPDKICNKTICNKY